MADLIWLAMTLLMNIMNCDFPIGRTGRVGNLGKATSFIDPEGDGDVMPKLVDMLTKVLKWRSKLEFMKALKRL